MLAALGQHVGEHADRRRGRRRRRESRRRPEDVASPLLRGQRQGREGKSDKKKEQKKKKKSRSRCVINIIEPFSSGLSRAPRPCSTCLLMGW